MAIGDAPKPNNLENNEKIYFSIIIADDSPAILRGLKMLLEDTYSRVEIVETGKLLLEKLLNFSDKFDLIITDNNMPEMSGFEVIQAIESIERLKNMPIIMLSADKGTEFESKKQKIINSKILNVVFLKKPVDPNILEEKIEKMRLNK